MLVSEMLKNKDDFSLIECDLANYLLLSGENIEKKTVRDIAKDNFISASTVMRFCKKLGFDGWNSFKEKYIEEIHYLESSFNDIDANRPFTSSDTDIIIANKLAALYQETISDTLNLIHHDHLQKASKILKQAKKIYVFSQGTALDMTMTFKEKMLKIGKNIIVSNNINFQFLEACQMTKNDCAIIISYSGETSKMIDIAKLLHENNIPIISLTSFGTNTIHQLSTTSLYISTREKLISNIGHFSSNLSISFLLDLLFCCIFSKEYEKNLQYKIKVSHQLEKTRRSDNQILKEDQ